jgi:peptidoglycan/LPS O-acetylase OafA/YrhL
MGYALTKRETVGIWMFLTVALISLIAGFLPVFKGGPMNRTFVAAGAFWLIMAIVVAARARKRSTSAGMIK